MFGVFLFVFFVGGLVWVCWLLDCFDSLTGWLFLVIRCFELLWWFGVLVVDVVILRI